MKVFFAANANTSFMNEKNLQDAVVGKALVTINEAAVMLGLSRRSIYRMIDDGVLEVIRPNGKAPRFRLCDIRRLIE
jgi:excisionase family DNA binding protein